MIWFDSIWNRKKHINVRKWTNRPVFELSIIVIGAVTLYSRSLSKSIKESTLTHCVLEHDGPCIKTMSMKEFCSQRVKRTSMRVRCAIATTSAHILTTNDHRFCYCFVVDVIVVAIIIVFGFFWKLYVNLYIQISWIDHALQ